MKQLLSPANATFSASAKTITFATTIPSTISHILHVTNVTRGVMYFQPQAGSSFSGTYASPVLTLACSTSGHADADKLEIFYDDGLSIATASNQTTAQTSLSAIAASVAAATPAGSAIIGKVGIDQTTPGTTNALYITGLGAAALVADNAASTGNPLYVGGIAVVSSTYAPAYAALDRAVFAFDTVTGALMVTDRYSTLTDQMTVASLGNSWVNITTATTTTAKSGAGTFYGLTINTPAASATITLYDNTAGSGTKIATITLPGTLLTSGPYVYPCSRAFATGLTAVTTGTTDCTLDFR